MASHHARALLASSMGVEERVSHGGMGRAIRGLRTAVRSDARDDRQRCPSDCAINPVEEWDGHRDAAARHRTSLSGGRREAPARTCKDAFRRSGNPTTQSSRTVFAWANCRCEEARPIDPSRRTPLRTRAGPVSCAISSFGSGRVRFHEKAPLSRRGYPSGKVQGRHTRASHAMWCVGSSASRCSSFISANR